MNSISLLIILIILLFIFIIVLMSIINKIRNKLALSESTILTSMAIPAIVIIGLIYGYYAYINSNDSVGSSTEVTSEDDILIQPKSEVYKKESIGKISSNSVNFKHQVEAVMSSLNIENINDTNSVDACISFQALVNLLGIKDYSEWHAYDGSDNNIYNSNYKSYIFINKEYEDSIFAVIEYGDYLYPYKITNENTSDVANDYSGDGVKSNSYTNIQFSNGSVEDVKVVDGQYVEEWFYDYITLSGYGSGNVRIMLYDKDKSGIHYYASYDEDISSNIIKRYGDNFVGDLFYQFDNNERKVYILRYKDSIIEIPMFY